MRVVLAPDSFGGTLTAPEAAAAMVDGWRRARPDDELLACPMSDGGEGLLDVLAGPRDTWVTTEVAGPLGHPLDAALLLRPDGTAVIESARACGLHLVDPSRRSPALATTYGVGQLLDAARDVGAHRLVVGLGGSATVDGGTGALTGAGFRVTVEDGSGLKVGAEDLPTVAAIAYGWAMDWEGIEVLLLADVDARLAQAAPRFGPQKGASDQEAATLARALEVWADVAERDLAGPVGRDDRGAGAAGGLGFGLGRALPGARLVAGADAVAQLVGLPQAVQGADLVVTGEGRLDATTAGGKVPVAVRQTAAAPVAAVVGQVAPDVVGHGGFADLEVAAPDGPGSDPAAEVSAATARLARRTG